MPGRDGDAYFVRLESSARPERPAAHDELTERPRPRTRRRTWRVRPLAVVLVALVGWLVWASTTDGGVSARGQGAIDWVRGLLSDATTDPALKRAATFYNREYQRTGQYPHLSDVDQSNADVGVGVQVVYCGPHAIVLQGLTGSGTKSRLLLSGRDLGDVDGEVGCPVSLGEPEPWELPE